MTYQFQDQSCKVILPMDPPLVSRCPCSQFLPAIKNIYKRKLNYMSCLQKIIVKKDCSKKKHCFPTGTLPFF